MSDPAKPSDARERPDEALPLQKAADSTGPTPFLFADGVAAFGAIHGTVHVVLEALELAIDHGNTVSYRKKTVAHLRLSAKGATLLQEALEKALLALMPVNGQTRN